MATINGTNGNDTLNGVFDWFSDLPDTINGLNGDDVLQGFSTNDTLNGGAGADTMNGGDGSDTYYVDNVGDVVGEYYNDALGGVDSVFSSVSYSLSPGTVSGGQGYGIENLTLTGSANINATGNGNDNVLTGNSGNNILNGGAGADTMNGGDGDDTYYVDNVGDVVAETYNDALGGVDSVYSSVNHTLGYGIENLTLTGFDNINATGNGNDNVLTGNSGNNILNGGLGADTMNGGDGSDTYYVDNVGDVVGEYYNDALGGVDSVFSSVSYSLSPGTVSGGQGYGIENLTLTGSANINATGNGNDNVLTGNSGNNILSGLAGNDTLNGGAGTDTMYGGIGNDIYYVDSISDQVIEYANQGTDLVYSSVSTSIEWLPANVENLTLTGTAYYGDGNNLNNVISGNNFANALYGYGGNDTLYGYGGNDSLIGGDGNDSLTGGSGVDTLWGGAGADKFIFNSLSEGIDIIKDFQWTEGDTIQISMSGFGATSLSQFSYNSSTGALFFDPSGITGPTQFATIENTPPGFAPNLDIVLV